MKDRPKIKVTLNTADRVIERLGWLAVFGIWILTVFSYPELPETIPIHYNASGKADGFGNKGNILALPLISTVLFIGLTVLNKYPHAFNYPFPITEKNAPHQYRSATRMIRILKLTIAILFGLIVYKTIQNAHGNADGLGTWFIPLTFAAFLVPMGYYLTKSMRAK